MAALLCGSGWVMAQAPLPAPSQPGEYGIRQVQALEPGGPGAPAFPGPGPLPGGPVGGPVPTGPVVERIEPDWQYWVSFDYLLWRTNKPLLPAVANVVPSGVLAVQATTSTTSVFPPPVGAVTSNSNGTFLIPVSVQTSSITQGDVSLGEQNGARMSIGTWLEPDEVLGVELTGLWLEKRTQRFATVFTNNNNNSNQFVINTGQTVPQTTNTSTVIVGGTTFSGTVVNPAQAVVLVGTSNGAISGSISTDLAGLEANTRSVVCWFGNFKFGALAGVRTLYFFEEFILNDNYTLTLNGPPPGAAIVVTGLPQTFMANTIDGIRARNTFVGPQVGLTGEFLCGDFFLNGQVKGGIGPNFQDVTITSVTTMPFASAGGSIFGPADAGSHRRTRISAVAEANFKIGYSAFDWLRAYAGFDFLYFGNAARTAEQTVTTSPIQVTIAGTGNTANVAPQAFHFGDVNAWFEGLTLGVELRY